MQDNTDIKIINIIEIKADKKKILFILFNFFA